MVFESGNLHQIYIHGNNRQKTIMKAKFLIKVLITTLVFSAILFVCAGKINYFQGWIFLATNVIAALMNFWATRNDPELMTERSKVGKDTKS